MIFAATQVDNSVVPIVVGAFVTIIGAFLAVAKIMLKSATSEREADRKERKELTDAIKVLGISHEKQADATKELVAETRKGNVEAKQRNGHLGEQSIQLAEMVKESKSTMLEAIQNIGEQHIVKQTIDKQVIHKDK